MNVEIFLLTTAVFKKEGLFPQRQSISAMTLLVLLIIFLLPGELSLFFFFAQTDVEKTASAI